MGPQLKYLWKERAAGNSPTDPAIAKLFLSLTVGQSTRGADFAGNVHKFPAKSVQSAQSGGLGCLATSQWEHSESCPLTERTEDWKILGRTSEARQPGEAILTRPWFAC